MAKHIFAGAGRNAWGYGSTARDSATNPTATRNTVVHLVLYAVGVGVFAVTSGHGFFALISAIAGQRTRLPYAFQALLTLALGMLAGICADPAINKLRRNWANLRHRGQQ
jgi:hypothetical protein